MAAIREARVPVFGVCLGHQSTRAGFGGKVLLATNGLAVLPAVGYSTAS
jgi:anthranilate/para-aminobenzoate synthase component II